MFSLKDYDEFDSIVKDCVTGKADCVNECAFLYEYELAMGKWYRSKEIKSGDKIFGSYMLNKKWVLEEEFNTHMLRFQQVNIQRYLFILELSNSLIS